MRYFFPLAFLIINSLVSASFANDYELKEINIDNISEGNFGSTFMVRIFDSYFPIPRRFDLIYNHKSNSLKFVSGRMINYSINDPVGSIRISPIEKCNHGVSKLGKILTNKAELLLERDLGFAKVSEISFSSSPNYSIFVIYNETSCIEIIDPVRSTWLDAIEVLILLAKP